jgi:hypothetical protein
MHLRVLVEVVDRRCQQHDAEALVAGVVDLQPRRA